MKYKLKISQTFITFLLVFSLQTLAQIDLRDVFNKEINHAERELQHELKKINREMQQNFQEMEIAAKQADAFISINVLIVLLFFAGNQIFWVFTLITLIRTKSFPEKTNWLIIVILLNSLGAIIYLLKNPAKPTDIQEATPQMETVKPIPPKPAEHPDAKYMPKA